MRLIFSPGAFFHGRAPPALSSKCVNQSVRVDWEWERTREISRWYATGVSRARCRADIINYDNQSQLPSRRECEWISLPFCHSLASTQCQCNLHPLLTLFHLPRGSLVLNTFAVNYWHLIFQWSWRANTAMHVPVDIELPIKSSALSQSPRIFVLYLPTVCWFNNNKKKHTIDIFLIACSGKKANNLFFDARGLVVIASEWRWSISILDRFIQSPHHL